MRPTVSEQLRETRRILSNLLMPQIEDDYTAKIFTMALSNLEMLEGAWEKVVPFLQQDNARAEALLAALRPELDEALAAEIDAADTLPAVPIDVAALEAQNVRLQSLLQRAIAQCGPEACRRIQAHLLERTARYPMRPHKAALSERPAAKDH